MAIYRYTIKTNAGREVAPTGYTQERRTSKKAQKEILARFVGALSALVPVEGARAICEVSGRFGPRTLAKYSYAHRSAHAFGPTGETWGARWILDDGEEGLPDFVDAGVPRKAAS